MANIGQWNRLAAVEECPQGWMLDGGEHGLILSPRKYLPEDAEAGKVFDVFVYKDSEDRLIATTEEPKAQVGEFACLTVLSVNPKIGAFLDWGLAKDLLLPFAEQLGRVRAGQRVVVAVTLDPKTDRIVASMRTNRHLDRSQPRYADGQAVRLLVVGETPLGYNAIVNDRHLGLLYRSELATPLTIGQSIDGYVRAVTPEGKIDLSLDQAGYQRVKSLKEDILAALENNDGYVELGDKCSPERVREVFGVSKKAFKQALGALYKKRVIVFEGEGVRLVEGEGRVRSDGVTE